MQAVLIHFNILNQLPVFLHRMDKIKHALYSTMKSVNRNGNGMFFYKSMYKQGFLITVQYDVVQERHKLPNI